MAEAAQRLKADAHLAGQPCAWCNQALAAEEEVALCGACGLAHHAACWDQQLGCHKSDCINAPLKRLDEPSRPVGRIEPVGLGAPNSDKQPPPGYVFCPSCKSPILLSAQVCDLCGAVTTPDGIYHGPVENAPGAVTSLVCGLIGVVLGFIIGFGGLIFGSIAISSSNKARATIRTDPRYGGSGMATAGLVLGIISIVLFVVGRILAIGMRHRF